MTNPAEPWDHLADPASWPTLGYHAYPLGQPGPAPPIRPRRLPTLSDVAERYDVVVIGSGAGGGVVAAVLAASGASVLVVERGHWMEYADFRIDHLRNHRLPLRGDSTSPPGHPRAVGAAEQVVDPWDPRYHNTAMTVGGGTRVYLGQAWRFSPLTFRMATTYGVPAGSALADWPIDYDDLAPYYDRVEWEMGVAGEEGHRWDGPRARGCPMKPFPPSPEAVLLAGAAAVLGWTTAAVPLLINTAPFNGRPACIRCAQCVGFPCPVEAKNDSRMLLVRAVSSGADVVCETQAVSVSQDGTVALVSGDVRRRVNAGTVVLSAGAVETARLLLLSGIGNAWVGRCLQGHVYVGALGRFDEVISDGLGPGPAIATRHFEHDNEGLVGGGMLASEGPKIPAMFYATALPSRSVEDVADAYLRTGHVMGPIQEIPTADARVKLAPTIRDAAGVPVAWLRGRQHAADLGTARFLADRAAEWMTAAGARSVWTHAPTRLGLSGGQHQAGTARMSASPESGATDRWGRVWGSRRIVVADGSLHVTNGGVNPVLTILANAWRIADHLAAGP